jgi:hypothetical protein
MAADTFISYKPRKGFWIYEIFAQLLVVYLYEEIAKPETNIEGKEDLLVEFSGHINAYTASYMKVGLFEYVETPIQEQAMIQVLLRVKTTLQNKGSFISVDELQAIDTEDDDFKIYYRRPFPTAQLIKVIEALIQMLQGTWTSNNYSMDIQYK